MTYVQRLTRGMQIIWNAITGILTYMRLSSRYTWSLLLRLTLACFTPRCSSCVPNQKSDHVKLWRSKPTSYSYGLMQCGVACRCGRALITVCGVFAKTIHAVIDASDGSLKLGCLWT